MTSEPALLGSVLVAVATAVAMVLAVAVGRRRALPTLAVVGAVALVVTSTALPNRWSVASGSELLLRPGYGGLGDAGLQFLRGNVGQAVELLALNALAYLPLGASLRWRWPSGWWPLVVPVVVSAAIEAVQYLALGRVAATDDVLVNVGGAVLGWALVWAFQRATSGPDASRVPAGTAQPSDRSWPVGPGTGS